MRTIKFRGKSDGKWYYGDLVADNVIVSSKIPYVSQTELSYDAGDFRECEEIGQFTGLLDSNGREIYEGDTLQLRNKGKDDGYLEGAVAYDETLCYFVWKFMGSGTRPLAEWVLDREYIITVKEE
jgi:uncharacterized phage protein (TIGR01671 family)